MSEGGQRSQEQWTQPKPSGKWKDVSNVFWDLGSLVKDKRSTWPKSCRGSLKTEQEVLALAEELKAQGSVDENTRAIINRGLKPISKIRGEEQPFKELLEDVQDRKKQRDDDMWKDSRIHGLMGC